MNQREIKFRAWNGKEMIEPQTASNNAKFFMGQNSTGLEYSEYLGKGNYIRYILMQYTGLIDKNGKEIYEGDIIKFKYDDVQDEYIGNVEWYGCGFAFHYKNELIDEGEIDRLEGVDEDGEVIGNIYKNPELLNL